MSAFMHSPRRWAATGGIMVLASVLLVSIGPVAAFANEEQPSEPKPPPSCERTSEGGSESGCGNGGGHGDRPRGINPGAARQAAARVVEERLGDAEAGIDRIRCRRTGRTTATCKVEGWRFVPESTEAPGIGAAGDVPGGAAPETAPDPGWDDPVGKEYEFQAIVRVRVARNQPKPPEQAPDPAPTGADGDGEPAAPGTGEGTGTQARNQGDRRGGRRLEAKIVAWRERLAVD